MNPNHWKPMWKWIRYRRKDDGVEVPSNWLGYSYRDFDRGVIVYYLIPFNWIFRIGRTSLNLLRYYWQNKDNGHTETSKAYKAGLERGKEIKEHENLLFGTGRFADGWNAAVDEMNKNGWENFKRI